MLQAGGSGVSSTKKGGLKLDGDSDDSSDDDDDEYMEDRLVLLHTSVEKGTTKSLVKVKKIQNNHCRAIKHHSLRYKTFKAVSFGTKPAFSSEAAFSAK